MATSRSDPRANRPRPSARLVLALVLGALLLGAIGEAVLSLLTDGELRTGDAVERGVMFALLVALVLLYDLMAPSGIEGPPEQLGRDALVVLLPSWIGACAIALAIGADDAEFALTMVVGTVLFVTGGVVALRARRRRGSSRT